MPRRASTLALLLALSTACAQPPTGEDESTTAPSPAAADPTDPVVLLYEPGIENAYPRLSNDGRRILYQSNRTGTWQLFVLDTATGEQQRLTTDAFNNNFVDWSADNEWVAFVSDRDGNEEIYRMRSDGTELERLTENASRDIHPYFSPDGKYLLFNSDRDNGSLDVYRLDLGSRELLRVTDSPMQETCARYSPDMKHIVLLRNSMTSDDVVILDVETGELSNLTNTPLVIDGWPMYSADGQWIYYSTTQSGQHSIHRVRPDGTGDETLTSAAVGEEDGRAFIGRDGRTLIFNKRKDGAIDIRRLVLPS
jgi:Tol biopolymer transport system component